MLLNWMLANNRNSTEKTDLVEAGDIWAFKNHFFAKSKMTRKLGGHS